nr:MAG TPA: hypothetical protein [Caudoviricetes sp.]
MCFYVKNFRGIVLYCLLRRFICYNNNLDFPWLMSPTYMSEI